MANKKQDMQQQPTRAVPEANELNEDVVMQPEAPVQGDAVQEATGTMPTVPEVGQDLFAPDPGTGAHSAAANSQKQGLQTLLQVL